jgi:hypothetical protein
VRASGYIARTCVVVSQLRERDLVGGTFTVDPRVNRGHRLGRSIATVGTAGVRGLGVIVTWISAEPARPRSK